MDKAELERIVAPHDSKAARIRALNEAGVSTSEISKFLGIAYQHSYNVLKRAGRIVPVEAKADDPGTMLILEVGEGGTFVLPGEVLRSFNLSVGDRVFCRSTEKGLLLMPQDEARAELRRAAAERMPEHASLLDALLGGTPSGSVSEPGG